MKNTFYEYLEHVLWWNKGIFRLVRAGKESETVGLAYNVVFIVSELYDNRFDSLYSMA